jgi:hypothetical protein
VTKPNGRIAIALGTVAALAGVFALLQVQSVDSVRTFDVFGRITYTGFGMSYSDCAAEAASTRPVSSPDDSEAVQALTDLAAATWDQSHPARMNQCATWQDAAIMEVICLLIVAGALAVFNEWRGDWLRFR